MKRMWLLAVAAAVVAVVALAGCVKTPPLFGPISPTTVIVVGDIAPVTLGSDGGGYEMGWRIPAPQYKELAVEFREALADELRHGFVVLQVTGDPAPETAELSASPTHPIVLKNLHFLYFPPSAIRWGAWVGLSAQVYQDGKKLSEFFAVRPTSILIAAGMYKEDAARRFVGKLKKLLPSTTAASAAR